MWLVIREPVWLKMIIFLVLGWDFYSFPQSSWSNACVGASAGIRLGAGASHVVAGESPYTGYKNCSPSLNNYLIPSHLFLAASCHLWLFVACFWQESCQLLSEPETLVLCLQNGWLDPGSGLRKLWLRSQCYQWEVVQVEVLLEFDKLGNFRPDFTLNLFVFRLFFFECLSWQTNRGNSWCLVSFH